MVKKLVITMLIGMTIMSKPMNAKAALNTNIFEDDKRIVVTKHNSRIIDGEITKKQYDDENYIIFITCTNSKKYDGETYMLCVPKKWYRKHDTGDKAKVMMYTNNTKSTKDDMIIDIKVENEKWLY